MQLNFSSICFIAKNSVLRFIEFNIFSQVWILNYVILQIKKKLLQTLGSVSKKERKNNSTGRDFHRSTSRYSVIHCIYIWDYLGFYISQHFIRINQFFFTKPSYVAWLPWACVFRLSLIAVSAFFLICCFLNLSQCTISAGFNCNKQVNPPSKPQWDRAEFL